MTKIDIISGFLGAGKTTLIKKLIKEAFVGEKLVLIENEFGEIGIDGGFLKDAGINITEMNSGCICCSLVGDFKKALKQVLTTYNPDRIIIEPSGVGKLSDVTASVTDLDMDGVVLNSLTTVADATKIKVYLKNFGEFFGNQIEHAGTIILSRTDALTPERTEVLVKLLKEHNQSASIITTPWDKIDGSAIKAVMEKRDTLSAAIDELKEHEEHHHHHHDDEECSCGHHHHHDEHEHHHDHHEHHHDENGVCSCGHHHEGHHHADDVFTSFGRETANTYTKEQIADILTAFDEDSSLGSILRAKGIVEDQNGEWIHFDYVPGESDIRNGQAGTIGRICVIGSALNEEKIAELFRV